MNINNKVESLIVNNFLKSQFNFLESIFNIKNNELKPFVIVSESTLLTKIFVKNIIKKLFNLNSDYNKQLNEHILLNNKGVTFTTKTSQYHIELNPSDYGIYDKNIINEYIYDISFDKNIITGSNKNFVIWNIDRISTIGQESLQNIFEKNKSNANYISTCFSENDLISSLKNTLLIIKLPKINKSILKRIHLILFKNNLDDFNNILNKSKISFDEYDIGLFLHYALMLTNIDFLNLDNYEISYHIHLQNFYNKIKNIKNITERNLDTIRKYIYEYYVNHIDANILFRSFLNLIILDDDLSNELKKISINDANKYQDLSSNGNKTVIHFEAFIFSFLYNIFKY